MKAVILSVVISIACFNTAAAQPEPSSREPVIVPFNLTFVPSISVGEAVADGGDVVSNLSFTIIGGSASGLQGVHYGGIWQTFTGDVTGVSSALFVSRIGGKLQGTQSSWIASLTDGTVSGGQASGIVNKAQGRFDGVQAAGIVNTGTTAFRGAQFAGIINNATGPFAGAEFAGIVNTGPTTFTGAQFAGLANIVNDTFTGAQFAGIVNIANSEFTGFQASGLINAAGSFTNGIQSAGLINVARQVGHDVIQIAPVNISQSNDGIPVGPISYVADMGLGGDLWVDESGLMNLGLRTGNDRYYNILSIGGHSGDPAQLSVGWTFGGSIKVGNATAFAIDGTLRHLNETDDNWNDSANELITLRFLGQWQFTDKLAFYAGPTINYCRSEKRDCSELTNWSLTEEYADGKYHRIWPGFSMGILIR